MTTPVQNATLLWLANGDTGLSSKTMAFWLAFGIRAERMRHPLDPSDFNRCLGLLAAAPGLRGELHRLGELSAEWGDLAARWNEIEKTFRDEVGPDWSRNDRVPATKTYALMEEILGEAPRLAIVA